MKQNKTLVLKSGLQSKYYLRLQSLTQDYPTQDDFIFECVSYVLANTKKLTNVETISFSKASLKDVFGDALKDPIILGKIKTTIQTMIQEGSLTKPDEDTLSLTQETISRLFSIV